MNCLKATRLPNGCLISHLRPNAKGYIPLSVGRRGTPKLRANRFVLEQTSGVTLGALNALHTCDNRRCIEPTHLYAGTAQQNSDDMVERNRVARLGQPATDTDLLQQALDLKADGYTLAEIARVQGLSGKSSAADRIRRAKML